MGQGTDIMSCARCHRSLQTAYVAIKSDKEALDASKPKSKMRFLNQSI